MRPQLASWAAQNRSHISEKLEGKLARADYLPWQDPDGVGLTEDEWKSNIGVKKRELGVLRDMYRRRGVIPGVTARGVAPGMIGLTPANLSSMVAKTPL